MSEIKPNDYQSVFFDEALEQIFDVSPSGQLIGVRIGKLSKIKKVKGIKGKVLALLKDSFSAKGVSGPHLSGVGFFSENISILFIAPAPPDGLLYDCASSVIPP